MKRNFAAKRLLWFLGAIALLWNSAGAYTSGGFAGIYRNSTGTLADTVYFRGTFSDSLVVKPKAADSVRVIRYRGAAVVDTNKYLFTAVDLAQVGGYDRTGDYEIALRASDGSGNDGNYSAKIFLYTGTQTGTTIKEVHTFFYTVYADQKFDTTTLYAAERQAIRDTLSHWLVHCQPNLLTNGCFERDDSTASTQAIVGWTGTVRLDGRDGTQTSARDGKWFCDLAGGDIVSRDTFNIGAGHHYYLGAFVWVDTTVFTITPFLQFQGAGTVNLLGDLSRLTQRQWQWLDTTFTVTTAGKAVIRIRGEGDAADTFYVDRVIFRELGPGDTAATARAVWNNSLVAEGSRTGRMHTFKTDSLYWVGRVDTIRVNGIALNNPVSGRVDVSVGNMGAGVLESGDAAAGFYKSITDTIWNERSDGHTAANTFGLFVDTTVSSRSSAAGSTDTAAIKTMMTNNRFARHFRSPGNPADTVNAVASLQSLGSGPYTATVYFLDSATSAAVQGWNASYRDSATQTQFTQAMASDANGKVQANVIGSTTYFVRGAKTAYRFAANADTTLNVAAVNFTDTVLVVGTGPTAPSSASVVRIDGNVRGLDTRGIPGLKVTATLIKKSGLLVVQYPNTDSSNTLVDYTFQSPARTDTSGAFTIDVPRLQTLSDTSLSYTLSFKGKNRDGKEVIYTWPCTRPPNVANWKWKPTNCVNE